MCIDLYNILASGYKPPSKHKNGLYRRISTFTSYELMSAMLGICVLLLPLLRSPMVGRNWRSKLFQLCRELRPCPPLRRLRLRLSATPHTHTHNYFYVCWCRIRWMRACVYVAEKNRQPWCRVRVVARAATGDYRHAGQMRARRQSIILMLRFFSSLVTNQKPGWQRIAA